MQAYSSSASKTQTLPYKLTPINCDGVDVVGYLRVITAIGNGLSCSEQGLLTTILMAGGARDRCYMSVERLAAHSKRCERQTTTLLNELVARGWLTRREASDDETIPKDTGWVYGLNFTPHSSVTPVEEAAMVAAPGAATIAAPASAAPRAEMIAAPQTRPECGAEQGLQSFPPSRSTYQEQLPVGSVGRCSNPRAGERAREGHLPTDSPQRRRQDHEGAEQALMRAPTRGVGPAPERAAAIARLRERIIGSFAPLDAAAMRAAMTQNWSHLQHILDCFADDMDAIGSWLAYKAAAMRARMGDRLLPHAPSKLLAQDAQDDATPWMQGRHAAQRGAAGAPREEAAPPPTPPATSPAPPAPQDARPSWWAAASHCMSNNRLIEDAGLALTRDEREDLMITSMILGSSAAVVVRGDVLQIGRGSLCGEVLDEVRRASRHWTQLMELHLERARVGITRVVWTG